MAKHAQVTTLGQFIRATRMARGQTVRIAAAEVDVSRQTWMAWEADRELRLKHFIRFADYAGVTLDSLRSYAEASEARKLRRAA